MSKETMYKDLIVFHPGSYVEDIVDDLNITQAEFAERLGTSSKTISKIINGEENISNDIANRLAKLTGISVKTWINLQTNYDLKVIEIENKKNDDEKKVCQSIDFSYFKKNNFVPDKSYTIKEKIDELRKLLNVSNLSNLNKFNSAVSYRDTREFSDSSIINSNVMLELAMNEARNVTDNKYKRSKLDAVLPTIRKMSLEPADVFYPKLTDILLNCGIVLVGLPKLKSASLNGATRKFKNGSVLLLITDGKTTDTFWLSLMHELGHIYNDDFYTNYEDSEQYSANESKANKFASEFFIPSGLYTEFIERGNFSEKSVINFSNELGILPSIVVEILQNDRHIEHKRLNTLKNNYNYVINKEEAL